MSLVPGRLKYVDSDENEQIIGVFRPSNPEDGTIQTFTIEESFRGYNRVIIEGEPTLQENMPTKISDFGTGSNNENEREIIAEIDPNGDGNWEKRARVQPEDGGITDDEGKYKHKRLYGFEKETGEDDVTIDTPIDTDIVDVLEQALPPGYTVEYPGDETAPNVNGFTYDGARQELYNDILEDFKHVIKFTPNLDANNDIIVRLQPKGYGGNAFNLERGIDPFVYDYYKPDDTSQVVSKVNIIGTADGNTIDNTYEPSDFGLDSADRERIKSIRIGYFGTDVIEANNLADEIGERNLNPNASTSLALDTELRPESNLNDSVGIKDDSRQDGDSTLNSEFTVVKQKDFLHQGISYFSFEFENPETAEMRREWRKHDEQQRRIYPGGEEQIDINFGDFNAENDTAEADNSTDEDEQSPDTSGSSSTAFGGTSYNYNAFGPAGFTGSASVSTTVPTFSSLGVEFYLVTVNFQLEYDGSGSGDVNLEIENTDTNTTIFNQNLNIIFPNTPAEVCRTITAIERSPDGGDTIEATISNYDSGNGGLIDINVDAVRQHDHTTTGSTAAHLHNVLVDDLGHGGSGDASEHVITGDQIQKLIDALQELKTDR